MNTGTERAVDISAERRPTRRRNPTLNLPCRTQDGRLAPGSKSTRNAVPLCAVGGSERFSFFPSNIPQSRKEGSGYGAYRGKVVITMPIIFAAEWASDGFPAAAVAIPFSR